MGQRPGDGGSAAGGLVVHRQQRVPLSCLRDGAAAVGVRKIVEEPTLTIETNVHGTEVVLRAVARKGKRCLLASTSEVYGKASKVPFSEEDDLVLGPTVKSRWAYACSKALDD